MLFGYEDAMQVTRSTGEAPKAGQVMQEVVSLAGPCVGCTRCRGLCAELLELLTLPDAVLSRN